MDMPSEVTEGVPSAPMDTESEPFEIMEVPASEVTEDAPEVTEDAPEVTEFRFPEVETESDPEVTLALPFGSVEIAEFPETAWTEPEAPTVAEPSGVVTDMPSSPAVTVPESVVIETLPFESVFTFAPSVLISKFPAPSVETDAPSEEMVPLLQETSAKESTIEERRTDFFMGKAVKRK